MAKFFSYLLVLFCLNVSSHEDTFPLLVKKIKRSILGIGVFDPKGAPRFQLLGSGFAFLDGSYIATNHHVIDGVLKKENFQYVAFLKDKNEEKTFFVSLIAIDKKHDLAILKFQDKVKIAPLMLANDDYQPDGTEIAFTGYPIGAVLGLYPVTHKGYISALTPSVIPANNVKDLSIQQLKNLRDPYFSYQLNATAYPGNSGSAVYNSNTGKVIAVINKVHVKSTKEAVLSNPSDITYAIPIKHLKALSLKIKN